MFIFHVFKIIIQFLHISTYLSKSARDDFLLLARWDYCEKDITLLVVFIPKLFQNGVNFLVFNWQLQVTLEFSGLQDEGNKVILGNIGNLELELVNEGDLHIVRSGAGVLIFLASENINSDNGCLGWSVLSGLSSGVFNDFAWETF